MKPDDLVRRRHPNLLLLERDNWSVPTTHRRRIGLTRSAQAGAIAPVGH